MARRQRIALILVWTFSLIIVSMFARAQTPTQRGAAPSIVSGGDLGFRVEGRRGDHVIGTLVVRVNGEWVVAEPAAGAKALSGR